MNKWMNGELTEWRNEWMNERKKKWTTEWTDECINELSDVGINE